MKRFVLFTVITSALPASALAHGLYLDEAANSPNKWVWVGIIIVVTIALAFFFKDKK